MYSFWQLQVALEDIKRLCDDMKLLENFRCNNVYMGKYLIITNLGLSILSVCSHPSLFSLVHKELSYTVVNTCTYIMQHGIVLLLCISTVYAFHSINYYTIMSVKMNICYHVLKVRSIFH